VSVPRSPLEMLDALGRDVDAKLAGLERLVAAVFDKDVNGPPALRLVPDEDEEREDG
jgi:hypothetical protein